MPPSLIYLVPDTLSLFSCTTYVRKCAFRFIFHLEWQRMVKVVAVIDWQDEISISFYYVVNKQTICDAEYLAVRLTYDLLPVEHETADFNVNRNVRKWKLMRGFMYGYSLMCGIQSPGPPSLLPYMSIFFSFLFSSFSRFSNRMMTC